MKTFAYQIEPARCKGEFSFEDILNGKALSLDYVAEEKFDGLRYLCQVRPNGAKQNYMTSRRISKVTGTFVEKQDKVPLFRDWVPPTDLIDTVLDGEVFSSGISSDTQHDIVSGNVDLHIWDLLILKGKDYRDRPLHERRAMLRRIFETVKFPPFVHLVSQSKCAPRLLKGVIAKHGEGIVVKDLRCSYGAGWYKVKGEKTFDCVIIGFKMATEGKYFKNNWIKNVRLGQYHKGELIDVGSASGMNEEMRERMTREQKIMIGKCVEVKAQFRLPSLKFRHPRFSRLRDDKNAKDCCV